MTDTPELRTSPDGRVAQKIPAHVVAVSNEGQRHLGWLAWEWPEGRLTAALLSDDDVADWTPLAALPTPPAEASRPTTQGAARALLQLIRDTYRAGNSDLTYDPEDLANEFLERYRITRRVEA